MLLPPPYICKQIVNHSRGQETFSKSNSLMFAGFGATAV